MGIKASCQQSCGARAAELELHNRSYEVNEAVRTCGNWRLYFASFSAAHSWPVMTITRSPCHLKTLSAKDPVPVGDLGRWYGDTQRTGRRPYIG